LRWIGIGLAVVLMAGVGCGRNPCKRLAETVCAQAQGTPACERAGRFTNPDECEGYLKDVERYIRLANEVVTTPVLKPPAPAPAEPPAPRDAEVAAPPDGTASAAPDPGTPSPTSADAAPATAPSQGSPEGAPSK